mgnify:CR=1 FL=1
MNLLFSWASKFEFWWLKLSYVEIENIFKFYTKFKFLSSRIKGSDYLTEKNHQIIGQSAPKLENKDFSWIFGIQETFNIYKTVWIKNQ